VKKLFLVVTPVKTGVQEVFKGLKILDSGSSAGMKKDANQFFHTFRGKGRFLGRPKVMGN